MENKKRKMKGRRNKGGERDRRQILCVFFLLNVILGSRFISLCFGYVVISEGRNTTQISVNLNLKIEAVGSCETLVLSLLLGTLLYCFFTNDRNVQSINQKTLLISHAVNVQLHNSCHFKGKWDHDFPLVVMELIEITNRTLSVPCSLVYRTQIGVGKYYYQRLRLT